MEAFFAVFLFIVGIIAMIGVVIGTTVWCGRFFDSLETDHLDKFPKIRVIGGYAWRILIGVSVISAIIAIPISTGFFDSNNEDHCGQGTRYISESHYNAATKTTQTDWQCVAS